MTPEEAIKQLEFDRAMILFNATTGEEITPEILKLINEDNYRTYVADGVAIEALKKIQQYRAIGTVDEIETVYAENKRWHTAYINKKIKNPFANTSTLICQNCDHKDEYIQELEAEIEKYRSAARCYKNAIEIVEKGGIK